MTGSPFARLPEVGDRLDRYDLVQKLGAGGMGAVFLGLDRGANLRRAIKLIPARADPETLLRFLREGRAMARVPRHPHVIQVMHAGETPACHYLVMEFAEGGDLDRRLEAGPLDPRAAVSLVRDLAGGLAHVHAHGVLHRDLKPANVVFQADGRALLTDFGLAAVPGGKSLTETGTLMGTPAYMAPEQALCEELDARTDVYGLGAVLYHALTGQAPYSGGSTLVLLGKVVEGNPTSIRALVPSVPVAVEALCTTAMAKAPADRYPDAEAFRAALDACLAAWSDTAPARRMWPLGVGGLALAGIAAAAVVATQRPGGEVAVTPTESAAPSPSPTTLPTPAEDLPAATNLLQEAQTALAAGDVQRARTCLEQLVRQDPESGEGWILLAKLRLSLVDFDGAASAAARGKRLRPFDSRPLMMLVRCHKGFDVLGAQREAMALLARARALAPDSREVRFALAMAEHRGRRIDVSEVPVPRDGDPVWTHVSYGMLLDGEGRSEEALPFIDHALRVEPYSVSALVWRGLNRVNHGRLADAIPDAKRALALRPDLPRVKILQMAVLIESGDLVKARAALEELRQVPRVPPFIPVLLDARILNKAGRHTEALALLERFEIPPLAADDWRLETARAYVWTSRPREALGVLARVRRQDLSVLALRGLARALVGAFKEARADLELYRKGEGWDTGESLLLQFELAVAQGELAEAQKTLRRLEAFKTMPAGVSAAAQAKLERLAARLKKQGSVR